MYIKRTFERYIFVVRVSLRYIALKFSSVSHFWAFHFDDRPAVQIKSAQRGLAAGKQFTVAATKYLLPHKQTW